MSSKGKKTAIPKEVETKQTPAQTPATDVDTADTTPAETTNVDNQVGMPPVPPTETSGEWAEGGVELDSTEPTGDAPAEGGETEPVPPADLNGDSDSVIAGNPEENLSQVANNIPPTDENLQTPSEDEEDDLEDESEDEQSEEEVVDETTPSVGRTVPKHGDVVKSEKDRDSVDGTEFNKRNPANKQITVGRTVEKHVAKEENSSEE